MILDIYYENQRFVQRTENSKIFKLNNIGQIIEKYESIDELPEEVKEEINKTIDLYKNPEKYFKYIVNSDNTATLIQYKGGELIGPKNLIIPEYIDGYEITQLDELLFSEAEFLQSLILPDTIVKINTDLCSCCENLKRVVLSNNITEIPTFCFMDCTNLSEINFPENLKTISERAFNSTNINGVIALPKSLKYIGESAFARTNFFKIYIPKDAYIHPYAFTHDQKLRLYKYNDTIKKEELER